MPRSNKWRFTQHAWRLVKQVEGTAASASPKSVQLHFDTGEAGVNLAVEIVTLCLASEA